MLDDRQLENLVRMAAEIEAMDALAANSSKQPVLRLAGQPVAASAAATARARRLKMSWRRSAVFGSITAAAAALAFAFLPGGFMTAKSGGGSGASGPSDRLADSGTKQPLPQNPDLWSGPTGMWPAALPWPFNGEPADPIAEAVPASYGTTEIRGALLAILEDDSGEVESVKWVEHDWDQEGTLAEAKASDLVAMSLMMSSDRTPRRMTVVGLRGPVSELPLGDDRAAELASCIVKAPARCSSMTCCNPGASTECIPEDVSVRFELVNFR